MDHYTWLGSTAVQYKRSIPVDIQRPDLKRKRRKRIATVAAVLIVLGTATAFIGVLNADISPSSVILT
jgi:hypothetical protein